MNDWTNAMTKGMKRGARMALVILATAVLATIWQVHFHLTLSPMQEISIMLPWLICGMLLQAIDPIWKDKP